MEGDSACDWEQSWVSSQPRPISILRNPNLAPKVRCVRRQRHTAAHEHSREDRDMVGLRGSIHKVGRNQKTGWEK